ncbi:hypothetical protein ACP3V3_02885 [Vibrio sp. PNB22_3_1]
MKCNLSERNKFQQGLYQKLILSGTEFDGMLNFGTITIYGDDQTKPFLLDARQTIGTPSTDENGNPCYELITEFEPLEETMTMFCDGEFDFEQCLPTLLLNRNPKAVTEVTYCDTDGQAQVDANVARIRSITLHSVDNPDICVQVKAEH